MRGGGPCAPIFMLLVGMYPFHCGNDRFRSVSKRFQPKIGPNHFGIRSNTSVKVGRNCLHCHGARLVVVGPRPRPNLGENRPEHGRHCPNLVQPAEKPKLRTDALVLPLNDDDPYPWLRPPMHMAYRLSKSRHLRCGRLVAVFGWDLLGMAPSGNPNHVRPPPTRVLAPLKSPPVAQTRWSQVRFPLGGSGALGRVFPF